MTDLYSTVQCLNPLNLTWKLTLNGLEGQKIQFKLSQIGLIVNFYFRKQSLKKLLLPKLKLG